MTTLGGEALRFAAVGTAATALHAAVGVTLIRLGLAPVAATVLAFAVAFQLSLVGHLRWSFRGRRANAATAAPRFLIVSLAGLAANTGLLMALLPVLPAQVALLAATMAAAGATFVLSRAWAFASPPAHRPRTGARGAVADFDTDDAGPPQRVSDR